MATHRSIQIVEVAEAAGRRIHTRGTSRPEVLIQCPWPDQHRHGDAHPSCRLNPDKNTFYCDPCGRGGGVLELASLLGVDLRSITSSRTETRRRQTRTSTLTFDASGPLGDATRKAIGNRLGKWFPPDAWRAVGVLEGKVGRRDAIAFPLPSGGYKACLFNQSDSNRGKLYSWRFTDGGRADCILVGEGQEVVICAGEWDLLSVLSAGFPCAATGTGGEGTWKSKWSQRFAGKRVHIVYDIDEQGRAGAAKVASSLHGIAERVSIIDLPLSGDPEQDGKDLSDYLAAHSPGKLRQLFAETPVFRPDPEQAVVAEDRNDWEPPVAFESPRVPEFPVASLPGWLAEFVQAESVATQTPTALAGNLVLAICSLAIAGRVVIRVRDGWEEPTGLYVVVVLDPGNRKSSVFNHATRPILDFERTCGDALDDEIRKAECRKRILEQRSTELQRQAAKATCDKRTALEQEAEEVAAELEELVVPVRTRLFADDVTPEKLVGLIREHRGRFAVLSAEGGIFEVLAGRYTNNGSANFDVFLKGHAGDPLRVDRVGRRSETIDRPALTLGLTIQRDVLRRLSTQPGFRGRGLLARFLYSIPASLIGSRKVGAPAVPRAIRDEYESRVLAALRRYSDVDPMQPATFRLSADAQAQLAKFETWLEVRLGPGGELSGITDWASKLAGAVCRIAAALHAADSDESVAVNEVISESTIRNAIRLGHFYLAHAQAAFSEMGADPMVSRARRVLAWIERKVLTEFSERDAFQAVKGQDIKTMNDVRPVLGLLVEHHYIRDVSRDEDERPRGGRPRGQAYEVNPRFSKGFEDSESFEGKSLEAHSDFLPNSDERFLDLSSSPQNAQNPQNANHD